MDVRISYNGSAIAFSCASEYGWPWWRILSDARCRAVPLSHTFPRSQDDLLSPGGLFDDFNFSVRSPEIHPPTAAPRTLGSQANAGVPRRAR